MSSEVRMYHPELGVVRTFTGRQARIFARSGWCPADELRVVDGETPLDDAQEFPVYTGPVGFPSNENEEV